MATPQSDAFVFPPAPVASLPVVAEGTSPGKRYAVHRIFCVGRNYAEHALEMGGDPKSEPPCFFTKPPTSLVDTAAGGEVAYPHATQELHHEIELVLAICRKGGNFTKGLPSPSIFGIGVGLDLTRRDLQAEAKRLRRPWDASKGFDRAAPCSPLVPLERLEAAGVFLPGCGGPPQDGSALSLELRVNGDVRQQTTLKSMIWNCSELVVELSKLYDIAPGDLVYTGTPAGVGPLAIGDEVVATLCAANQTWAECRFRVVEPAYHYNNTMVHGIPYPPNQTEQVVDWLRQHVRLRPTDIVCATYPKCGTTWLEQAVLMLVHGSDFKPNPGSQNSYDREQGKGKIWLEATVREKPNSFETSTAAKGRLCKLTLEEFDQMPTPRVLKTHAPPHLLVGTDQAGRLPDATPVLVMTRNPKDTCVSMYFHAQQTGFAYDGPFAAWQKRFLAGDVEFGSFFEWHRVWWSAKQSGSLGGRFLWMNFEDMIRDKRSVVASIASHLGLDVTAERIDWVVEQTTFSSMKRVSEKQREDMGDSAVKLGHYRKGETGDWKNHFSESEAAAFDACFAAKTAALPAGSLPTWPET